MDEPLEETCINMTDENITKMKAEMKAQRARLLTKTVDEKHHKD